jgi:ABC-type nitrate/sulfonate/bicarbonate transport system permease component
MSQTSLEQGNAFPAVSPPATSRAVLRRWGAASLRLLPLLLFVAVWQGLSSLGAIDEDMLPAPIAIVRAFVDLAASGELLGNLLVTLESTFLGLLVGTGCGVALGVAMASSRVLDSFFGPLVKATYSLPKTALVPLLILWLGIGTITNTVTVALAALLPVVVYTYYGIRSTPRVLVWSALSMGTPKFAVLRKIALPAAMHAIFVGVRIALGFSYVLAIAAEMIAANAGIGKLMFQYGQNGAYDYMFAAVTAIVIVAYLTDRLLVAIMEHVLRWDDTTSRGKP